MRRKWLSDGDRHFILSHEELMDRKERVTTTHAYAKNFDGEVYTETYHSKTTTRRLDKTSTNWGTFSGGDPYGLGCGGCKYFNKQRLYCPILNDSTYLNASCDCWEDKEV